MKRCSSCQVEKPLDDFPRAVKTKGGYHNQCKACKRTYYYQHHEESLAKARRTRSQPNYKEKQRAYLRANKEKVNARNRAWYSKNREAQQARRHAVQHLHADRQKAYMKKWHREHPEYGLEKRLRRYGLDRSTYGALLWLQSGRCAICFDLPKKGRPLVIDHDHTLGRVRGLLCDRCNGALGMMQDMPLWLRAAASYLELAHVVMREAAEIGRGA